MSNSESLPGIQKSAPPIFVPTTQKMTPQSLALYRMWWFHIPDASWAEGMLHFSRPADEPNCTALHIVGAFDGTFEISSVNKMPD